MIKENNSLSCFLLKETMAVKGDEYSNCVFMTNRAKLTQYK